MEYRIDSLLYTGMAIQDENQIINWHNDILEFLHKPFLRDIIF